MMNKLSWATGAAMAVAVFAAPAQAQDWGMDPTFGTHDLVAGFQPDPYIVTVVSGGGEDVASRLEGCNGFVATAPDVRVNYTAGGLPLTFAAAGPDGSDVTILINGPDATWYCNDDVDGTTLNAALTFTAPVSGQYDIWIGTFMPGENFEAALAVTELVADGSAPLAEYSIGVPYDAAAITPDVELVSGFEPDPVRMDAYAGGPRSGAEYNCIGWYGEAPNAVISYQASDILPLILSVGSQTDTTLMVVDPYGQVSCDDDSGNGDFNPSITFSTPATGLYAVFIGTYLEGDGAPAYLSISELYSE